MGNSARSIQTCDVEDLRAMVRHVFGMKPVNDCTVEVDFILERMRRGIDRLSRDDHGFLHFVHHPKTDKYKPWAFVRVWVGCIDLLKNKNIESQRFAATMLELLLVCYRSKVQSGEPYPAEPWVEIEGLGRAAWKKTYEPLWVTMDEYLVSAEKEILDSLR